MRGTALSLSPTHTVDTFFKFKWTEGKRANQKMRRAVNSVVGSNCAFFRPWGDERIHVYDSEHDNWHQLPDCPYVYSSLAYVCNVLTTIGGQREGVCTDKLLCLTWEKGHTWQETLPPMPTKRKNPISVTVGMQWLVVSGGIEGGRYLTVVELYNTDTKLWASVASLPEPIFNASVTFGGGCIYMLGGNREPGFPTTTVMACQVAQLFQSSTNDQVWKRLADLPVERSSCVCVCGQLLAIGGQRQKSTSPFALPSAKSSIHVTSSLYKYSHTENTWSTIGDLEIPVSECFAALLPGNKLMVLGGNTRHGVTDRVQFGTFNMD